MTLAVRPRKKYTHEPFFSLLDEFFPTAKPSYHARDTRVASNVLEFDDYFLIELAVPGFIKEDFNISVEDDRLKVVLNKELEANKERYKQREFKYGHFQRVWNLGESVDQDQIHATYDRGILSIKLVKKEEAVKPAPKEIKIS